MASNHPLAGVYAAAVTPLRNDSTLDLDSVPALLAFLASRGCHGALFFGTTGEGPSFSPTERESLLRSVRAYRQLVPGFRILAGTGTPSLSETIDLTKLSFDLGYDGVVVLPPYYFRNATDEGLFEWFSELIKKAVPSDKYLLGYHFPKVAGIGLSVELLSRLKDAFPVQFAGIKDSSHDPALASTLGEKFGSDMVVLTGTDSYLQLAMQNKAAGCITAPANLISPDLREVWDLLQAGKDASEAQARATKQRHILEKYPPFPSTLKALMHRMHELPKWSVKPPLEDMAEESMQLAEIELTTLQETE
ncbi:MAG TPA: dihydrodipicolinate synthase family protein [Anaerolineales bacterium]|nr:dihydrodipicolinate synthase family protein [Anaerolineales bacterium]